MVSFIRFMRFKVDESVSVFLNAAARAGPEGLNQKGENGITICPPFSFFLEQSVQRVCSIDYRVSSLISSAPP